MIYSIQELDGCISFSTNEDETTGYTIFENDEYRNSEILSIIGNDPINQIFRFEPSGIEISIIQEDILTITTPSPTIFNDSFENRNVYLQLISILNDIITNKQFLNVRAMKKYTNNSLNNNVQGVIASFITGHREPIKKQMKTLRASLQPREPVTNIYNVDGGGKQMKTRYMNKTHKRMYRKKK